MTYTVSMQRVLQEFLERRVIATNREKVATVLGISLTALDYLRAGGRKIPDPTDKDQTIWQDAYISFQHVEKIAQDEKKDYATIMKEIAILTNVMEIEGVPNSSAERPGHHVR